MEAEYGNFLMLTTMSYNIFEIGPGPEAEVIGEMQKLGIEDRLDRLVAPGHHVLPVVIENLGGHTPKKAKCTNGAV